MLCASVSNLVSVKTHLAAVWIFEESTRRFDPWKVWSGMEWPARTIVLVLLVMSAWSLGVMIDRWVAYRAAAQAVAPVCSSSRGRAARGQSRRGNSRGRAQ
jgi:biopolymer transport protein ExbB/biopolymer transport protein TolQ